MDDVKSLHDLLWLLPTGVGAFGVWYLRSMSASVTKLNEHMAVQIARTNDHHDTLKDHESRLRKVERD